MSLPRQFSMAAMGIGIFGSQVGEELPQVGHRDLVAGAEVDPAQQRDPCLRRRPAL